MFRVYQVGLLVMLIAGAGVAFAQVPETPEVAETPVVEPEDAVMGEVMEKDYRPLEIELRGWFTSIGAESSVLEEVFGGKLDIDSELGLDDDDVPEIRFRWQFAPKHALVLRYVGLDYSGSDFVAKPLLFDGGLAGIFNTVKADLSLDYGRIGWRWSVVGEAGADFKLDTILDVAILSADASYERYSLLNPFFPADDDDVGGTIALPLIGLAADLKVMSHLEIFGELSGMYLGNYGSMLDLEAGARILLGDSFTLSAGYRLLDVDAEYDDEDGNLDFSGPFVGVSVRF
jgi:hypothetical protein